MEDLKPIAIEGLDNKKPIVIAGPCSAETEEQVLSTAKQLAACGVKIYRAGIWKPRTKPGGFEGVGEEGLEWLKRVKAETGMAVATEVANKAHVEAALKAGAKEVEVIAESLAAAIGAKIPIYEPAGHMICDIGGGTTEVSVISLSGMVVTHSIRVGGDKFDEAIVNHVRTVHNLRIGLPMAERLKIQIGNAAPEKTIEKMELRGTDGITGLPRRLEIDSVEVREALKEPVTKIVEEIKSVLGLTPPELAADIIERGIVMTGGGSMLRELPRLISKETGVPVILVENPKECVALGAGEAFELFKDMSSDRAIYDSLND